MGCDIDYYLDHDFGGLDAKGFLEEFKRRVAPLEVGFTGFDKSPYANNKYLENGWTIYCWEHDYETAFNEQELSITFNSTDSKYSWRMEYFKNSINLDLWSDLNFSEYYRWRPFEEMYLENNNPEIAQRIEKVIHEIETHIVPVFHCKKFIAIGDQGLYEAVSDDMWEGKTIEEALQNKEVIEGGCKVKICRHSDGAPYVIKKDDLPVWMYEF